MVAREEVGLEETVIPPRNENVPAWRMEGRYGKEIKKKGYRMVDYNQQNMNKTVFSVMKRLFVEAVTLRKTSVQNKQMVLKMIVYNPL